MWKCRSSVSKKVSILLLRGLGLGRENERLGLVSVSWKYGKVSVSAWKTNVSVSHQKVSFTSLKTTIHIYKLNNIIEALSYYQVMELAQQLHISLPSLPATKHMKHYWIEHCLKPKNVRQKLPNFHALVSFWSLSSEMRSLVRNSLVWRSLFRKPLVRKSLFRRVLVRVELRLGVRLTLGLGLGWGFGLRWEFS